MQRPRAVYGVPWAHASNAFPWTTVLADSPRPPAALHLRISTFLQWHSFLSFLMTNRDLAPLTDILVGDAFAAADTDTLALLHYLPRADTRRVHCDRVLADHERYRTASGDRYGILGIAHRVPRHVRVVPLSWVRGLAGDLVLAAARCDGTEKPSLS
jgi:hypothetical protein